MANFVDKYIERRKIKKEKKIKEQIEYENNVVNYNRVVAIELANRRKPKKAPSDAYISLQNINKIYDNLVQAVYDFNLDIKKNEFIVFVGPSGCGKSTTLRMIAGLEEITAGNLYIDGEYANGLAPKDRNIAMVFQSYALYPHMSVYDNMAFSMKIRPTECIIYDENGKPKEGIDESKVKEITKNIENLNKKINAITLKIDNLNNMFNDAKKELENSKTLQNPTKINKSQEKYWCIRDEIHSYNHELKYLLNQKDELNTNLEKVKNTKVILTEIRKLTKEEIDERVHKAAQILQIEEYLDRKPKALSGGQRQRVALGRAICKSAKLFLMDEPLSNLDAKLRVSMRSEIIKLHKAIGSTSIYVTHDQTEAMTMADRIVIMEKGVIQQIGTPKEIYNYPSNIFVATFIGSPSMNISKVEIKDNLIHFDDKNTLKLDEESITKLKSKIEEKLDIINKFIENGLDEEYQKEINVKKEMLRIKLENTGKRFTHNDNGDLIDQIEDVKLDSEELRICKNIYETKLKDLNKAKKEYETMLKDKVYKVIFGIRPEDVYVSGNINNNFVKPSNEIELLITIPELLGNEYFLHSELGSKDFVIKTSANNDIKENTKVNVVIDLNKIHLFDSIDKKILI